MAEGSAVERTWHAPGGAGHTAAWNERVLVGRSPMHADHQPAGLAKRLRPAEPPLAALPPPRGRGKRHSTTAATLREAMARVLQEQRVESVLSVAWQPQVEQTTPSVGRGRGSKHREKRVSETIRSHRTQSARQEDRSAALRQRCGWKAFVTHAEPARLS